VTGSEHSSYNYKKLIMVNGIILLKQTNGWLNQFPDKESCCIKTVYIKNSARQNVRSKGEKGEILTSISTQ
jgi:hypothetical protein